MKGSLLARLRLAGFTLLGIAAATLLVGASSSAGAATSGAAPVNTVLPVIGGPPGLPPGITRQRLVVSSGKWTGSPTSYAYEWMRCHPDGMACRNLASGTSYTPVPDDIGHALRVTVTAKNAAGPASATSPAYPPVSSSTPRNTQPPVVSGTPKQGNALSTNRGSWAGPRAAFSYGWLRCDATDSNCMIVCSPAVLGACQSSYTLVPADVGETVRSIVLAEHRLANGVSVAASAAVSNVYPLRGTIAGLPPENISPPTITGLASETYTLTAAPGSWRWSYVPPTTYGYQWQRCDTGGVCADIAGATSSRYALAAADIFHTLHVVVTATNAYGSASATSASSASVVGGAVSAGIDHTCAVASDGSVWCWGHNGYGELGNGDSGPGSDSSTPVHVKGVNGVSTLSHVIQVSAGGEHTCALLTDGTVDCWGANPLGELGYSGGDSSTPVPVTGLLGTGVLSHVVQVSAGGFHTCALLDDGTIACWGWNGFGILGGGTIGYSQSNRPIRVVGVGGTGMLSQVIQVSAAGEHTCALLTDGTVDCWGSDMYGQLGDGAVLPKPGMAVYSADPVHVTGAGGAGTLSGVKQVSAGWEGSCALLADGTVDCWGANGIGQPGAPTYDSGGILSVPVQISAGPLGQVLEVSTGFYLACALVNDGTVDCWGSPSNGDLGDGKPPGSSIAPWIPIPSPVEGPGNAGALSAVTEVSAGQVDACALSAERTVWCWGWNEFGQLGNGVLLPGNDSSIPIKVISFGATDTLSPP